MFSKKFLVTNDFIDQNGHLSEVGYYFYAVQTVWEKNKIIGINSLLEKLKIGPIIFNTSIEFKKEVFLDETININMKFSNILDNGRKWTRNNEIFKENGDLSAIIISNGAFFSRETRKVITPPEEIFKKVFINN
jgi:acyl-CoA thioesterase FadM